MGLGRTASAVVFGDYLATLGGGMGFALATAMVAGFLLSFLGLAVHLGVDRKLLDMESFGLLIKRGTGWGFAVVTLSYITLDGMPWSNTYGGLMVLLPLVVFGLLLYWLFPHREGDTQVVKFAWWGGTLVCLAAAGWLVLPMTIHP